MDYYNVKMLIAHNAKFVKYVLWFSFRKILERKFTFEKSSNQESPGVLSVFVFILI